MYSVIVAFRLYNNVQPCTILHDLVKNFEILLYTVVHKVNHTTLHIVTHIFPYNIATYVGCVHALYGKFLPCHSQEHDTRQSVGIAAWLHCLGERHSNCKCLRENMVRFCSITTLGPVPTFHLEGNVL